MALNKNQHGFTFIELCIVMAIISILSAIAFTYFNDIYARGRDSAAVSDAISLITVVNNHFLDKKSVNYQTSTPDGTGIGVEDVDGNPIPPVFTFSPGVRIQFDGTDNISPSDEGTMGKFFAYIYHYQGTPDPDDIAGYGVFRRGVLLVIDEASTVHEHTLF
jgi:prepilin-type N-terminal cleavage/methylation domain-containing protein